MSPTDPPPLARGERGPLPVVLVVLGAPNDEAGRLLPAAESRARAALAEYRRDPSCRVLLTGGFGGHFNTTLRPHHEYVARFLVEQGLPAWAILGGLTSRTTLDDAEQCRAFLGGFSGPLHLRVVTSDYHAERARLVFERAFPHAASLAVVAAPTPLPPAELERLRQHEAQAIARLTG